MRMLRDHWLTWVLLGLVFGATAVLFMWAVLEPWPLYHPVIWFGRTVL